jgi:iron complex transport system substrate-binding protein
MKSDDSRLSMNRRALLRSATAAALIGASSFAVRDAAAQATPAASPAVDAFPVSIDHVYGTTLIESQPVRVVTLGWSTQDAVIDLGIIPVAIPRNDWGGDADGFLPWTRTAIGDAELPLILDTNTEIPFEAIVGVKPDVILAPYSGITEDDYKTLSAIAPTVAYPETPWGTSWQDVTLITGRALGLSAEAQQLVEDTNTYVEKKAAEYPSIAGKSFVYGSMGDGSAFNIYTVTDSRVLFLSSLGMVPSDFVQSLEPDTANTYFVPISYERANQIEGDVVVFWFGTQEEADTALETTQLAEIPAVKAGAYAPIVGESYVMANSAFSTLSIPYMLEDYMPQLAAATGKVAG